MALNFQKTGREKREKARGDKTRDQLSKSWLFTSQGLMIGFPRAGNQLRASKISTTGKQEKPVVRSSEVRDFIEIEVII